MPRDALSRSMIDKGWPEAHEAACDRLTRKEVLAKFGIDEGDM